MDGFFSRATWDAIVQRAVLFMPQLGTSLVILAAFWIMAGVLGNVLTRLANKRDVQHDLLNIAVKSLRWSLLAVGIVTALGTLGIDIGALVAGLGLTGFALSIALKDIVSNVLAGVMIIAYKPFQRHDRIVVAQLEGTVAQIDLRYTTLELEDKKILVPNSNLLTNPITVFRASSLKAPSQRVEVAMRK